MGNLNKVMLIGRITADPEISYTQGSNARCKLRIAVNRYYKNADGDKQEEAMFFNVVSWGNLAETISKYMEKGREIFVEGRLRNYTITDEDGKDKYFTEVVAETVQFLGGKGENGHQKSYGAPGGISPFDSEDEEVPF
jgi:single-strand DNA-binding protein